MRKVRLPKEPIRLHFLGAPWSCQHITLGEADAIAWAAEDRLRRPGDDGCRFVRPVDSAACAGCFTKGRSSSHQLNLRCRRVASINIAGGYEVWYPWLPSKDNPADEPSRRFEPRGVSDAKVEVPSSSPAFDLRELSAWKPDTGFFIHFCSGPRRKGDLLDAIEILSAEHGIEVQAIAIDPLADVGWKFTGYRADVLQREWFVHIITLIHTGRVVGGFGSPRCSTISAASHVATQGRRTRGPRPLRARQNPWVALPCCTPKESVSVDIGTALFLITLGLLGEVCLGGGWIGLEHPADRKREPFPSFFATPEVGHFMSLFRLYYTELDQCMYGAVSKKPIQASFSSVVVTH